MRSISTDFTVAAEQVGPAWNALKRYLNSPAGARLNDGFIKRALDNANRLAHFLKLLDWEVDEAEDGEIYDLTIYEERNYTYDDYLFAVIAPYVEAGSTLELQIGNYYYRYEFDGTSVIEYEGEICYTTHHVVDPNDFPEAAPSSSELPADVAAGTARLYETDSLDEIDIN